MVKRFLAITCLQLPFALQAQKKDTVALSAMDTLILQLFPKYADAMQKGVFDEPKDTSWTTLQTYETDSYSLKLPANWIPLGSFGALVDQSFDASELYFPDTFNARPVLTGLFILNQPAATLEQAKDECLQGYRANPDRVFEKNYTDSAQKVKLSSGQHAYLLHTRFFRLSTQLNQSRYDLVVYSEKKKQAYLIMVSVQYSDDTYYFETRNNLAGFAKKIFGNFALR